MSKEHPFILYAGPIECGQRLSAEARGWYVLLPQDDLEALAMYSVYCPDVSIIDRGLDFAYEVEFHLHSINAPLILVDQNANPQTILDTISTFFSEFLPVGSKRGAWNTGLTWA
jgi:hypothetical protein